MAEGQFGDIEFAATLSATDCVTARIASYSPIAMASALCAHMMHSSQACDATPSARGMTAGVAGRKVTSARVVCMVVAQHMSVAC